MPINLDGNLGVYTSGNVSATGNITGNYYIGNGALLTGISGSGNVDLTAVTTNVIPASNVALSLGNSTYQWKDLWLSNATLYFNSVPISLNSSNDLLVNNVPVVLSSNTASPQTANIATTANVVAGNVVVSSGGVVKFPDGSTQTTAANLTGVNSNVANTNSNVANLTTSLANTNANVANNASNIATLQGQVYANANVAAYLPTYTGTLTATDVTVSNTVTATTFIGNFQGNITGNLVVPGVDGEVLFNDNGNAGGDSGLTFNKATNDLTVGNLVTANSFLGNGMTINGNVFITGNANIQGNLTYNNITNLTTSNLVLGLGNNQTGISVSGGGIAVGNTDEATLLYNFTTQTWDSNLGINAVGNIDAPYFIGDGSQLANITAANITGTVAQATQANTANLATLATTATSADTAATVTANAQSNITSVGVLTSLSVSGDVTANSYIGDGSQLTGIAATFEIYNGTSNVNIPAANGNIDITVNGNSAGRFTTTGSIVLGNATGTVGNNTIALNGLNTTFNTPRSGGFYAVPVWGGAGVAIPGTSPTSGVVNAMYYDYDTSEINFAPSMQYSQFLAPFSTPTMTAAQAGGINQASGTGPILPAANSVPVGTTITFMSSGTGTGVRPTVGDFIYINNTNITNGGLFEISPNESAVFVSRGPGTTEWDVFGTACAKYSVSNNNTYGAINKIGIPAPTSWNTTITMDYWQWQMQDDGYLYMRTTSGTHTYAANSTTVNKNGAYYNTSAGTTNGPVTIGTTFVKQWNQFAGLSIPGESVVVLMEDADSGAVYRITSIKNNSTPNRGALIVERLI